MVNGSAVKPELGGNITIQKGTISARRSRPNRKDDFSINYLEVCGRFQRRGGIDINPIRGTHNKKLFVNFREFNQ